METLKLCRLTHSDLDFALGLANSSKLMATVWNSEGERGVSPSGEEEGIGGRVAVPLSGARSPPAWLRREEIPSNSERSVGGRGEGRRSIRISELDTCSVVVEELGRSNTMPLALNFLPAF